MPRASHLQRLVIQHAATNGTSSAWTPLPPALAQARDALGLVHLEVSLQQGHCEAGGKTGTATLQDPLRHGYPSGLLARWTTSIRDGASLEPVLRFISSLACTGAGQQLTVVKLPADTPGVGKHTFYEAHAPLESVCTHSARAFAKLLPHARGAGVSKVLDRHSARASCRRLTLEFAPGAPSAPKLTLRFAFDVPVQEARRAVTALSSEGTKPGVSFEDHGAVSGARPAPGKDAPPAPQNSEHPRRAEAQIDRRLALPSGLRARAHMRVSLRLPGDRERPGRLRVLQPVPRSLKPLSTFRVIALSPAALNVSASWLLPPHSAHPSDGWAAVVLVDVPAHVQEIGLDVELDLGRMLLPVADYPPDPSRWIYCAVLLVRKGFHDA